MKKILITGATGGLGSQVIQLLRSKTDVSNVAALVRNESKAEDLKKLGVEIRKGDYEDIESLKIAFKGIDKILFISANDLERRIPQHKNVLEAIKQSNINHVVYTSFVRKNETDTSPIAQLGKAHIYTDNFLLNSGITYTILRNTLYMEYAPYYMGDKVVKNQMVYLPAGSGKVAFLTRTDMAEIATNILTSEGHENKIYTISGEEAFSYGDIAKMISKITGKEIKYVSPSVDEFVQTLKNAGLPDVAIGMTAGFAQAIEQGEFEETNPEISKLLGRKPLSLENFLKNIYS